MAFNVVASQLTKFTTDQFVELKRVLTALYTATLADLSLAVDDLTDVTADPALESEESILVFYTDGEGGGSWVGQPWEAIPQASSETTIGVQPSGGGWFKLTAGTAVTINIQDNTDSTPEGVTSHFYQSGAGQITIASASAAVLRYPSDKLPKTRAQYSVISIKRVGTNEWVVYGDLASV